MELMAGELADRVEEDRDRRWPALQHDLVMELIWNRFQRLMIVWRDSQPQIGMDGREEDPDE